MKTCPCDAVHEWTPAAFQSLLQKFLLAESARVYLQARCVPGSVRVPLFGLWTYLVDGDRLLEFAAHHRREGVQ
jgi:hypothetical protein